MDLSVIIPVYRETRVISRTLSALARLSAPLAWEVIVVDGEPEQTTLAHLKAFPQDIGLPLTLIPSSKGRGPQMNAGAMAAQGSLFLFLHADTRLCQENMDALARVWQRRAGSLFCGAFDLAIDSPSPGFRIIEKTASLRSRLTRLPYGDQGIFISKPLFERVAGFPDVPLMEDVGLMQRVKAQKIRPLFLMPPIQTSARRWETHGMIRTTLKNWVLILLYLMGAPPEKLARYY